MFMTCQIHLEYLERLGSWISDQGIKISFCWFDSSPASYGVFKKVQKSYLNSSDTTKQKWDI